MNTFTRISRNEALVRYRAGQHEVISREGADPKRVGAAASLSYGAPNFDAYAADLISRTPLAGDIDAPVVFYACDPGVPRTG